jgi:hypothetical protein
MITVESDIKLAFDQLRYKFQSILNEHSQEIETIVRNAIANFNFEEVLKAHVEGKINQGLEEAFNEIDLKESLKSKIWAEIEKKMSD